MSLGRCEISAVINPCFYGVSLPVSRLQSLVGLYGIVPAKPKNYPGVSTHNLLVFNKWIKFNFLIKELLYSALCVEFKQECLVDGVPFGNIYLTTINGIISLKSYLVLENVCTVSKNPDADSFLIKTKSLKPSDFDLSPISPSVKAERKLRTRLNGLKKPPPLLKRNKTEIIAKNISSCVDSAIVTAILKNIPDTPNFIEQYSKATGFQRSFFSNVEPQSKTESLITDSSISSVKEEEVESNQFSKSNVTSNVTEVYPTFIINTPNKENSLSVPFIKCTTSILRQVMNETSEKAVVSKTMANIPSCSSVEQKILEKLEKGKELSVGEKHSLPPTNHAEPLVPLMSESVLEEATETLNTSMKKNVEGSIRDRNNKINDNTRPTNNPLSFSEYVKAAQSRLVKNDLRTSCEDLEMQLREKRQQRRNTYLNGVHATENSQILSRTVNPGCVEDVSSHSQETNENHSTSSSLIQCEGNDSELNCSSVSYTEEDIQDSPYSTMIDGVAREEEIDNKIKHINSSNDVRESAEPDGSCKSDSFLNEHNDYSDIHSKKANCKSDNNIMSTNSFDQTEKMRTSLSSLLEESATSTGDISGDEIIRFSASPRRNKTDSDTESCSFGDRMKMCNQNSITSLSEDDDKDYAKCSELPSDYTLDEYLEKIVSFEGLIHGRDALPPINWFSDSSLHSLVITGLINHNIKDLLRSQSFAIPNILNRRNVTIIGIPRSGKTLAAVIPLIGLLCEQQFYDSLKKGSGARAVFITSCAQRVNNVSETIRKISSHLTVVSTYGGGSEIEKLDEIINGCDVLVSTPRCWLRVLKYRWITRINRLCHLVIDDINLLIDLYKPELFEIIEVFESVKKKRGEEGPEPQIILVGESWTPILSDIVIKRISRPLVSFTSLMEAAFYANIKPTFHVLSPSSKADKLLDLLKMKDPVPTVIICNSSEDVCLLRNLLYTTRLEVLVAHGDMLHLFMMKKDIHSQWQNSIVSEIPPLLIACDDALVDLGINNATWLIHYSLCETKTTFDYRFSTIKSLFCDRLSESKDGVNALAKVDIFLDHSVEHQLPDITALMHRFKAPVPHELLTAVEKISKKKEKNKGSTVDFCKNMIQFGHCWKKNRCKQQHCLNYNRDKPKDLPLSGFVGFKVLKIHSPIHFSVRLTSFSDSDATSPGSWAPISSCYMNVVLHINRYYAIRSNRRMHGTVKVGDLAGIEVDLDAVYARVKVLQIIQRDAQHNASTVLVHFIDEGSTSVIKAFKLLHLPKELTSYPQSCVDLYLTNLQPVDLDRDWSIASTKKVFKKLNSFSDNYFFEAKISLVLGYKMLIECFKVVEALDISKCSVVHMDLRNYLLSENIAVQNPEHLIPLIELCTEAEIPTPALEPIKDKKMEFHNEETANVNKAVVTSKNVNKNEWAHLPQNEVSTVILKNADNPSLIYVAHEKYDSLLGQLEKEICEHVKRKSRLIDLSQVESSIFCLAKFEDKWNRAILSIDIQPDADANGVLLYHVQFVDYGDTEYLPLTDIRHCPEKFKLRLPFQAIKCELAGIQPVLEEWNEDVVDVLYDVTKIADDAGSYIFKSLSLIVVAVKDADNPNQSGKYYNVIILYKTDGTDVILNEELVARGYASWLPGEKEVIDSIIGTYYSQAKHQAFLDGNSLETKGDTKAVDPTKNEDSGYEENISDDKLISMLENFDILLPSNSMDNSPLRFLADLQQKVLSKAGKIKNDKAIKESLQPVEYNSRSEELKNVDKTISTSVNYSNSNSQKAKIKSDENTILCEYQLKSGYYTPKAAWFQTPSLVVIRIMIPGIDKYSLSWSMHYFDFSTTYDGRRYRLIVDLFGPVVIDSCQHFCRGQYVELKMAKVLAGYEWPQLLYDERDKPMWLETIYVPHEEEDDLNMRLSLGELKSKKCKFEPFKVEGKVWHYDPEDGEESDTSDVFQDANHDPYNPLD